MPNLGELRRSAVVSTFGPGAVVDFRAEGAAVSAVAAGLEEWDANAPPAALANPQTINEPRLETKLGVKGFRLPPVPKDEKDPTCLTAVRFPDWLQCPQCHHIKPSGRWNARPGQASRYCGACTAEAPGQQRVSVVPVRFVVACELGHLEDFPWNWWLPHKQDCRNRTDLLLKAEGAGLAGLVVSCPTCMQSRSMDGVFGKEALRGFSCSGKQPWLGVSATCHSNNRPRVLQRGASNLYFPVIHSALSIPPWSDQLQQLLGQYWQSVLQVPEDQREKWITILQETVLSHIKLPANELAARVNERASLLQRPEAENLRVDEYHQFISDAAVSVQQDTEFELRREKVPAGLQPYIQRLVRVVRLREVRAITGFTRIEPPSTPDAITGAKIAPISRNRLSWFPAIEVRGEGIFIELSHERFLAWSKKENVVSRAATIQRGYVEGWRARYGDNSAPPRTITSRFVLAHTFAHALMRQLSLDSGYSATSLRERLYVDETSPMFGVLIYTSTTDSDGTLGGLARQGAPEQMQNIITTAIQTVQWCSSDPLCIRALSSLAEANNLAACHACVLAPETSCEEYNSFLDRALLIGLPDDRSVGFFSDLLELP